MKKDLKKIFLSPFTPLLYGTFVTLFIVSVCYYYYFHCEWSFYCQKESAYRFIESIDQRLFNLKQNLQNSKEVSKDIAILAVDDMSLKEIGRWPWRREKIAHILEESFKYKIKLFIFDMVFSEASDYSEKKLLFDIQKKYKIPSHLLKNFKKEVEKKDSDRLLAEALRKHKNHVILGNFYEKEDWLNTYFPSYTELCHNLSFNETKNLSEVWKEKEPSLVVFDSSNSYFPLEILSEYKKQIQKTFFLYPYLNLHSDSHFNSTPQSSLSTSSKNLHRKEKKEEVPLKKEISFKKWKENYCENHWLHFKKDIFFKSISSKWDQFKKTHTKYKNEDFLSWSKKWKESYSRNPILISKDWVMNRPSFSSNTSSQPSKENESHRRNKRLKENKTHVGFFNAHLNQDGVITKSRLFVRASHDYKISLPLKAFLVAKNYNILLFLKQDSHNRLLRRLQNVTISSRKTGHSLFDIPLDNEGRMFINYSGPQKAFPHISALELLNKNEFMTIEKLDPKKNIISTHKAKKKDFLKNKILFFSVTAKGVFDMRVTPKDENFPGVEIHANVLNNLIQKDFLFRSPKEGIFMIGVLLFIGLLLSVLFHYLKSIKGFFIFIVSILLILLIDFFAFSTKGLLLASYFPLSLVSIQFLGMIMFKVFLEEREKKKLKNIFSSYVSPSVFNEILSSPSFVKLEGKKKHVTVLFSDIRNFTQISEKMDPLFLNSWLSSYLTSMTEMILKHRGTLDKFVGDAIIAFFGAPIEDTSHALNACLSALSQIEELKALRKNFSRQNWPLLKIGIGINTGECYVGDIGSKNLRNYSILGETVNITSRLEALNKKYKTEILISEETFHLVKESFICREIDYIYVKGRKSPLAIYELVNHISKRANFSWILDFRKAYTLYRNKNFKEARKVFMKVLETRPIDAVSQIYIERSDNFIKNPPKKNES